MRIISMIAGALCGSLVGAVAALLLAPMPGEELRGRAQNSFEHLVAEATRAASERRLELQAQIDRLATSPD